MRRYLIILISLVATAAAADQSPVISPGDLSRARGMLRLAHDEVVRNFYDPARLGHDFSRRCAEVEKQLENARSNGEALMMIAQVFLDLGDSHTLFIPPSRMHRVDHGWAMHVIGDGVYVSRVEKGSEAEKLGLKVGDSLLSIDGIEPRKTELNILKYLLYGLIPRPGMRLIVQAPGAKPRQLDVPARVIKGSFLRDLTTSKGLYELLTEAENEDKERASRYVKLPGDILVWKLRQFDEDKIAGSMLRAAGATAVVLDLRGNGGGLVTTCQKMLRSFFAEDFLAYTERERDKTKKYSVDGSGRFTGPLFVLIDHQSASASELFAKTVQMRGRGTIIGERSGGLVSTGRIYPLTLGTGERFISFAAYVTVKQIVMADGSNLEKVGVTPDITITPSHEDLYLGRDPVLAKALELAGHQITPEAAGRIIPD